MNSHRTSDDVVQRCLKLQIARCRAECRSFAPKIAKNADWVLTTAPACGIIIDVAGNNTPGTPHGVCGRSSSGRAPPCQGGGSEFEPRRPLQHEAIVDAEMQRRWLFCVSFLHRTAKNTLLQADGTVRLQKLCISSCQTARNEVFYSHSLTL